MHSLFEKTFVLFKPGNICFLAMFFKDRQTKKPALFLSLAAQIRASQSSQPGNLVS